MRISVGDLFWAALLGAECMTAFLILVLGLIGARESYKNRRRRKEQKALRESKEAEARKDQERDVFFGEVQAFYDGI